MDGRNPLVADLLALPLERLEVADYGCGPGNLIPHLAGREVRFVGVDASAASVDIAAGVAERHGVPFEGVCGDFRSVDLTRRFDYGDFPDAPEEVWDWYVEAQIAP